MDGKHIRGFVRRRELAGEAASEVEAVKVDPMAPEGLIDDIEPDLDWSEIGDNVLVADYHDPAFRRAVEGGLRETGRFDAVASWVEDGQLWFKDKDDKYLVFEAFSTPAAI